MDSQGKKVIVCDNGTGVCLCHMHLINLLNYTIFTAIFNVNTGTVFRSVSLFSPPVKVTMQVKMFLEYYFINFSIF